MQQIIHEVWGGAGEHGRSCYYVYVDDTSILLDCGGKKEEGGLYPQLCEEKVRELQAVFLSHAHEDHMAALPLLLSHGYQGEVWLTKETYRQLPKYALAWKRYVEKQGKELPYAYSDWDKLQYRLLDDEAQEGEWLELSPELKVCWGVSGHMTGAIWLLVELSGRLLFYSGDYSNESNVLRATLPHSNLYEHKSIELAIVDAAYGASKLSQAEQLEQLLNKIEQVYHRGGHILLPVPLSGRGLDLMLAVREKLKYIPVAAEKNLLQEWLQVATEPAAQCFLREGVASTIISELEVVVGVSNPNERQLLVDSNPHIIFSPDGMLLSEPALTYATLLEHDARHAILLTGHLSKDAQKNNRLNCEMGTYRYKVHQGIHDVKRMINAVQPLKTLLVHTSAESTEALIQQLIVDGYDEESFVSS